MSEANNTTKKDKKQYHHLTKDDRVKIETLISQVDETRKRLYLNKYIAKYLVVDKSTIGRELKKRIKSKINIRSGKITNKSYNAEDAQNDYRFKRALSKAEYKLEKYPKMRKYIEDKILIDRWMPDAIVGYMKLHNYFDRDGFECITVQTIYNAIRFGIIKNTKTQIYFCHPYCSGEKGTNERNNEIIRYFIPKSTLLENYSFEDINKITEWMNNYPRKSLNYRTPLEALLEEFNDKAVINKIYKLQEKVNC